eukprot:9477204-Pyramimonas_sp.AAC.1
MEHLSERPRSELSGRGGHGMQHVEVAGPPPQATVWGLGPSVSPFSPPFEVVSSSLPTLGLDALLSPR